MTHYNKMIKFEFLLFLITTYYILNIKTSVAIAYVGIIAWLQSYITFIYSLIMITIIFIHRKHTLRFVAKNLI